MEIDGQRLRERLGALRTQEASHQANLNAVMGAIQDTEFWIRVDEAADEESLRAALAISSASSLVNDDRLLTREELEYATDVPVGEDGDEDVAAGDEPG